MKLHILIVLLLTAYNMAFAETLKDPRARDEDISHTVLKASYNQLSDGSYEYLYDIESPSSNKGRIAHFLLDLQCAYPIDVKYFKSRPIEMFKISSKDGNFIPVQPEGVMYFTYWMSITAANEMLWGVGVDPGQFAKGYRLMSPAKPGLISYRLVPSMDADGWDYNSYEDDDPTVPKLPEFTVTGMITGPACPGKSDKFPGTNKNNHETEAVNALLSYTAPLRSRFHVARGTKDVELTIHYAENIDAKTFKAEPGYIRPLFDPKPGTSQTVKLPLLAKVKKNTFKLEVRAMDDAKGNEKTEADRTKDSDEFEVRVDP